MLVRLFGKLAIAAILLGVVSTSPRAGSISLAWDAVPNATGYRVYYGASQGQYTSSTDVGNVTSATLTGLTDCTSWHVAVKAYNAAGESPNFSNEVSGWARPVIGSWDPPAAMQGSQFTLNITGANFQPGAIVETDNPNVFLSSAATLSCNQVQVAATIEPTALGVRPAQIGKISLTVVNPDQVFGTRTQTFDVQINPARFDVDRRETPTMDRLDGMDVAWLSRLFGSAEGGPTYNPDSDFNGDGWIDGQDLAHLASNMGRCWDGTAWNPSACPDLSQ